MREAVGMSGETSGGQYLRSNGRRIGYILAVIVGALAGAAAMLALEQGRQVGRPGKAAAAGVGEWSERAIVEAVKRAGPAVVNITTTMGRESELFPELRIPFGEEAPAPETHGAGSGVIIDPRGYILTNAHVVVGAERVSVRLADEREFEAKVVGRDRITDTALVKVKSDKLPTIQMGSSKNLPVGAWVIAIGNPFAFENSVTVGVLSAKHREMTAASGLSAVGWYMEDMLQTDAAINSGNSGGALVDLAGRLVGVPTAIVAPVVAQGIGFAIPVEIARRSASEMMRYGRVRRAWIGISYRNIRPDESSQLRVKAGEGVVIERIWPDSAAKRADLRPGDVITRFNDTYIRKTDDLVRQMRRARPGQRVTLMTVRQGRRIARKMVLGEMPAEVR
jgi:S1-C subfamily serine protease